ncbi:MAG: hypothetical protein WCT77_14185 [Bacteroidota bacterium]
MIPNAKQEIKNVVKFYSNNSNDYFMYSIDERHFGIIEMKVFEKKYDLNLRLTSDSKIIEKKDKNEITVEEFFKKVMLKVGNVRFNKKVHTKTHFYNSVAMFLDMILGSFKNTKSISKEMFDDRIFKK